MPKIANHNRAVMLAVTTALATTALGGCATKAAPRAEYSASKAQTELVKGNTNKAVSHAEQAVMAEPQNAAYRAMLGATYMEAGRFVSAATSFKDAMTLGDNSPRTALSYALAEVAAGNQPTALKVLDDWRDDIDPADLGLAFALAGDADRGVHILGNALRGGANTPKVRQNLAYAYALKGDWRSARLMAAEDVPADQINARISEWAQNVAPEQYQVRVAKLLDVPVVGDTGQPAMLALSNTPSTQQLAAEALGSASAPKAQPIYAPAMAAASTQYELPPLGGELPATAPATAPAATPQAVVAYSAPPAATPKDFADAFAAPKPASAAPKQALAEDRGMGFVSKPVVQKLPTSASLVSKPSVREEARGAVAGEHLIQLGSFSSEASARRAWGIYAKRYSQLEQYDMVITKAVVRGKTYFRVSAGGFERASAKSMCSSMKAKDQGCIAWAANAPLPGAVDYGVRMARR